MTAHLSISFLKKHFELIFWIVSLIALFIMDPISNTHFSFCVFKFVGFDYCPGCGLGHSISFLLHGKIKESFQAHPLGLFALPVLLYRIFQLSFSDRLLNQNKNYEHI